MTRNLEDAQAYADLVAKERGTTPAIIQAAASDVRMYLDDVPGAIAGEKMIPADIFSKVPTDIFKVR